MDKTNVISGKSGISWYFEEEHVFGRYANGDYWVEGPIELVGVTPGPIMEGSKHLNGTQINPKFGSAQGWDSGLGDVKSKVYYDHDLNVGPSIQAVPNALVVEGSEQGDMIVSAESYPAYVNGKWVKHRLRTADVLTVVRGALPSEGDFRPPYCKPQGIDYNYNVSSMIADSNRAGLASVGTAPDGQKIADGFRLVHIHNLDEWNARYCMPRKNMPDYGRERAELIGDASLMYHCAAYGDGDEDLEEMKVGVVQAAIDILGICEAGGSGKWYADGGINIGIKWTLMFGAHLMSDNSRMLGFAKRKVFQEDQQTFYIDATTVKVGHGYDASMITDPPTPEWGIRHGYKPEFDYADWESPPGKGYRGCCTHNAQYGTALAAMIHGDHNNGNWGEGAGKKPFFDYQARHPVFGAASNAKGREISWDKWQKDMFDAYVASYP